MIYLEIEVKIAIGAVEPIKKKISALGFRLIDKEFFETNIIFDTADNQLGEKGFLLRLRKKNETSILTFKRPGSADFPGKCYKVREEIESGVSNFENVKTILMALGFEICFIYEKYREVYKKKQLLITIDRTPIGNFIEIEGEARNIDDISEKLGYQKKDYIVENYHALFRKIKKYGFMVFS